MSDSKARGNDQHIPGTVHLEFQEFLLLLHQVNSSSNQTTPLLKFKVRITLLNNNDDYDCDGDNNNND